LTLPCLVAAFDAAMDRAGPFEPRPALAIAVSGGADSMALAVLARDWARARDGSTLALVVDHGLRAASADEASSTIERLAQLKIPARKLRLSNLQIGPALAERARIMRYEMLTETCRDAGILHLLLGHHAADQVETLVMRVLRGSQTHGLAGMPALRETASLRLLRPLLEIEPGVFRRFLAARGVAWVEDPSNQDLRAMRPRLRHRLAGHSPPDTGLVDAIAVVGRLRAREEREIACELASRATIRPEGFALLSPGRIGSAALTSLIQTIGGAPYAPGSAQIDDLAAQPRPATVAGTRIMAAGRFGDGFLIVREEAAVMEPVRALQGIVWDHRFRLTGTRPFPESANIGKLGADAARFRAMSDLPSSVLRTLPAVRSGNSLAAVPHLRYAATEDDSRMAVVFAPPRPVAGACFMPANQGARPQL
jgi:tRNA(Ile)-lysidine synthase